MLTRRMPRTCHPIHRPDSLRERLKDHLIWAAALVVFVLLLSQATSSVRTPRSRADARQSYNKWLICEL